MEIPALHISFFKCYLYILCSCKAEDDAAALTSGFTAARSQWHTQRGEFEFYFVQQIVFTTWET
jgi:hypothetical protein